jgi:nitrite reductase/ring-hydroxylating ferredoxin subunit
LPKYFKDNNIEENGMVLVKAGPVNNFAGGKMAGIREGGRDILVANLDGRFYAIGNICTHMGCRISGGRLEGENARCPCHGSVYSLKTGDVVHGPAKSPVPSYRVELKNDEVWVDV